MYLSFFSPAPKTKDASTLIQMILLSLCEFMCHVVFAAEAVEEGNLRGAG